MLQRERAALATPERFLKNNHLAGLVTARLAGGLALAMADSPDGDGSLPDGDIRPWFANALPSGGLFTPAKIPNIPLITLARAAPPGPGAHTAPTTNGAAPATRAEQPPELSGDREGGPRVSVDLTKGFAGLPPGASVVRSVWLKPGAQATVVVRDSFRGLTAAAEIGSSWLGGAPLAWTFVDGWARLSDGEHALWIGTTAGPLKAERLEKVEGSRGPLTLGQRTILAEGRGETWWAFVCTGATDWHPPLVEFNATSFRREIRGAVPVVWELAR